MRAQEWLYAHNFGYGVAGEEPGQSVMFDGKRIPLAQVLEQFAQERNHPELAGELPLALVREAFRKIANNERPHGSFLTAFARAFMLADPENELRLYPAAVALLHHYKLEHYGTEPPSTDDPWPLGGPRPGEHQ